MEDVKMQKWSSGQRDGQIVICHSIHTLYETIAHNLHPISGKGHYDYCAQGPDTRECTKLSLNGQIVIMKFYPV